MSDQKISIFNFDNYLDFLKVVAQPKEAAESSKLTLEDWAKKLGYRSPSSLSMVLKGQRLPSQDMLQAFEDKVKDFVSNWKNKNDAIKTSQKL